MTRVYVTVIAYNEEKLTTAVVSDPIDFDQTAPVPSDYRVLRTLDGAMIRRSCLYGRVDYVPPSFRPTWRCFEYDTTLWTSSESSMVSTFIPREPSVSSRIVSIETRIGTSKLDDDVALLHDVGRIDTLNEKQAVLVDDERTSVQFEHDAEYYPSVLTKSSSGNVGDFSFDMVLHTDHTMPPLGTLHNLFD